MSTERVVNIVWELEDESLEGFNTNQVFRAVDEEHESILLGTDSRFVIESTAVDATPFSCRFSNSSDDQFHHKHGCYSAE